MIYASILLLVAFGAQGTSEEDDDTAETSRDRRQVFHFSQGQPYAQNAPFTAFSPAGGFNPYSVYPPHSPTAQLSPFSIYARPAIPIAQTYNLGKAGNPPALANIKPVQIGYGKRPVHKYSRKPTITKAPLKSFHVTTEPYPRVTVAPHIFAQVTPAPYVYPHVTPIQNVFQPFIPQHHYEPEPKGCPHYEECVTIVKCAPSYLEIKDRPYTACTLYNGVRGVCCPPRKEKSKLRQLFTAPSIDVPIYPFTAAQIDEAARAGLWELVERDNMEQSLQDRNIVVNDKRDPKYGHLQFFRTSPLAMKLSRDALTNAESGDHLVTKFRLSPEQAGYGLQKFSVKDTIIENTCPAPPRCGKKEKFYRTSDGSCNNLQSTMWGQARTTLQRILPPVYSDGLFRPRESRVGGNLPSSRVVSISVQVDVDRPSEDFTLSLMQMGQFIDHDIAHTPIFRFGNESGIECCSENDGMIDPSFKHPSCFPIEIPADDPFYSKFGQRCMNFVRSMFAPRGECNFGYAEQMNQITHYIDNSNIYGSSKEEAEEVREHKGGLLKVQEKSLLPVDNGVEACESKKDGFDCFLAGDNRVNEQTGLALLHTVWMREHNRLARELAYINPHWSDETIYQEARRIVNAQYQHIVYNEWLPVILGKGYMEESGLLPRREGYSRDYDSGLNAATFNEFATVAFRFGHTLVQGMLKLFGKKGVPTETIELHTQFNDPKALYTPGKLDEFLRGLATQPIQQFDNFVTSELTNRLFQTDEMPFGMDLIALNTQRARDHAIAPYNDLRAACGLPRATTFDDLLDVIPERVVNSFKRLYAHVDDIDPFIAGISERSAEGSVLGPTFRCIVGEQFTRLKRGDRFFYDFADMPASFTEAQLYEIRHASWARILCNNGDYIQYMQPLAFFQPKGLNERVSCDDYVIPKLDLTPWISAPEK